MGTFDVLPGAAIKLTSNTRFSNIEISNNPLLGEGPKIEVGDIDIYGLTSNEIMIGNWNENNPTIVNIGKYYDNNKLKVNGNIGAESMNIGSVLITRASGGIDFFVDESYGALGY